ANDAVQYALILAFVTCGNNLLNITKLHEYVDFRTVDRLNLKQHLKPLFSFGVLNLSSSVYLTLDTVILGMFPDGDYQVGLYQLAVKLRGFLAAFISGVINASISRLSIHAADKNYKEYDALLSKNLGFITNLSFAIACYLLVFSQPLVILVSSQKYAGSILPLRLSGFAIAFSAINTVFGFQILTPWGKEKELAISNSIGVPVSIGLNLSLDGRFGADGAAFAYLMTESAVFVAQFVFVRKTLKRIVKWSGIWKIILCLSIATVLSFAVSRSTASLPSWQQLAISVVVFFVPWYVLAFVTKEDSVQMINQIFAKMLKKV
ncbi:MAG: polysaccharide biosynthesis C-terminal domain-containing protein, partial [Bifidobacteriaceae bacterium]|nr:polysaccharide biosynthesis C-terminal domain-containing protein [Bifidobacteriaceae bacterium]